MATFGDTNSFDNIMELFVEQVKHLGGLRSGAMYGRNFLMQHVSDSLSDAYKRTWKALKHLSSLIAERRGPPAAITSEEISFSLLEAGLVNILFACLPKPGDFEASRKDSEGLREFTVKYHGFKELVEYLSVAVGREAMRKICGDPLLNSLFSALDRAVASSIRGLHLQVWQDELCRLAWETRGYPRNWSHKPPTVSLLYYLRWEVQGRKGKSYDFEKPWTPQDPERLRHYQQVLALPLNRRSGKCGQCSAPGARLRCMSCQPELSDGQMIGAVYCNQACRDAHSARHAIICQETKNLSRVALLFQITFVQYLLSVNSGTTFVVSEEDGVVYSIMSKTQPSDQLDMGPDYVGVSPDLDLSQSNVDAALHGFHCCDIKGSARPLMEYFFRDLCTSIEFLSFVPKNASTPLEVESSGWLRFNMSALHTVALLTTHNNSERKFVLDPTAAQFGWKEYLVKARLYDRYRIHLLSRSEVCQPQARPRTPTEHTPILTEGPYREDLVSKFVAEQVLESAKAEVTKKGGLDAILLLPQPQFNEWTRKFKDELALEMRRHGD